MSKVGKQPINIPEGVEVKIAEGEISATGENGETRIVLPRGVVVEKKDNQIIVSQKNKNAKNTALWGTYRSLISNMVKGVSQGWKKELEMVGTGYRCQVENGKLVLIVGFSHPVTMEIPEKISVGVEKNNLTIEGPEKDVVGQFAAKVRAVRPPEPYKGKGIKYIDEVVRRKPGKAAKGPGAAA